MAMLDFQWAHSTATPLPGHPQAPWQPATAGPANAPRFVDQRGGARARAASAPRAGRALDVTIDGYRHTYRHTHTHVINRNYMYIWYYMMLYVYIYIHTHTHTYIYIYTHIMYTCAHTHTGCVYWLGNCLIGLAHALKLCQLLQFDGNANLGRTWSSKIQWAVDWTVLACFGPSQTAFDPEYPLVKLVKET